jgi:chromosome segregation ATPase
MKIFTVVFVLALICGLNIFDHWYLSKTLTSCEQIVLDSQQQRVKLETANQAIKCAISSQEITRLQAQRISTLEIGLTKYTEELALVRQQNGLLEKALETAATQIKNLVDDNSKLEADLDAAAQELRELNTELLRIKEALADKIAELEKLRKVEP